MKREEALELLKENVKNENLIKHCLASEAVMKSIAKEMSMESNEEEFAIAGLLHDIDFEKVSHNQHGKEGAKILKGKIFNERILHAIEAHNPMTGIKPSGFLDYALICGEIITGLIVATALVMPDKKLSSVTVESLKKKFKEKSFAAKVPRDSIMQCEKISIKLDRFLEISLKAMQEISDELGL